MNRQPCRILLVSDAPALNAIVREVVDRVLHCELVAECHLGQEGTRLLTQHRPNLILLHAPLPDKPAQVFIHKTKAICADARIILITDRPEMSGFVMAQRKGADGYISCRLLHLELPLVLGRYHELAPQWGHRFSPWKEHYGMA